MKGVYLDYVVIVIQVFCYVTILFADLSLVRVNCIVSRWPGVYLFYLDVI